MWLIHGSRMISRLPGGTCWRAVPVCWNALNRRETYADQLQRVSCINVGGDDFYIDLLFYDLDLRCYGSIELKTGNFRLEYARQLSFYLSMRPAIIRESGSPNSFPESL
ncbi:MAG: DUF1016 domain-containing protein [Oscillibacter sp.]|nr:DUF1016 domain-containing protein [Oscillibacter sp.]